MPTNENSGLMISARAKALLDEMASTEGVPPGKYLEALLHYAGSCHKRPASWEANVPFDYVNYDDRNENGRFADRWF